MSFVPEGTPAQPSASPARATLDVGLRLVAAIAILIGGLVHLQLYFRGGYRSFPNANLGRSFLLNGVASVLIAAALLIRRDAIVRLAGIAVSTGTLIAFALTRHTDKGIFGFTETGLEPSPQAALSLIVEILALVILVASFVPALTWKHESFVNAKVASGFAAIIIAVGVVGSVVWARTDTDPAPAAVDPGTTVSGAPASGDQAISIKDFTFTPPILTIAVGDTVTWTNADGASHSVQSADQSFDSPDKIASSESFSYTFTTPGKFTSVCGIHQYMKGTIEVAG